MPKLLQNTLFESLTSALSIQGDNIQITGSVESYSCKMTSNDKKLYKELNLNGTSPFSIEALSPSESQIQQMKGNSPLTPVNNFLNADNVSVINRKMLCTLISILNASFPDYEFSHVKSEEFSLEPSLEFVVNNVNTNLSTSLGEDFVKLSVDLWKTVDNEICLQECQIYSYNPEMESDPFGDDGSIWSFNYFFFNKQMNRLIFFKCSGNSLSADSSGNDYDENLNQFQMEFDCDNNMASCVY